METFKLTIDGIVVEATQGMTVLQAAKNAGLFIPSLCAHDELSPYGACRLCVVEIDGVRGTPTSCTTPAAAGMVVRTNTEQLQLQRCRTIELMMSSHPAPCLTCDSREDCESEKVQPTRSGISTRCGTCSNRGGCELRQVTLNNYTRDMNLPIIYSVDKIERNDPFIDKDHNLCVLCGRCFRVCEKLHDKPAISIANRGKKAKISSEFEKAWSSEECVFCGACIDECPTGCLTDRWGKWFGEEEKVVESFCTLCPRHCKVGLKVKDGRVIGSKMLSLKKEDCLCALGKFAIAQILNSQNRLNKIQVNINGELTPAGVEVAQSRLAEILENTKGKLLVISSNGAYSRTRKSLQAVANKYSGKLVELALDGDLPTEIAQEITSGKYACVISLGNFITSEMADKIEHLVIADFVRTPAQKKAEVLLPIAILGEVTVSENEKEYKAAIEAAIDRRLAAEYFESLADVSNIKITVGGVDVNALDPRANKSALPHKYMGHYFADFAPDLISLGLKKSETQQAKEQKVAGFKILEKNMVVPNFHEIKISAPDAAKYVKPGQFAILMANMNSERSPFTIIDWNAQEGWIKFIVEEVGRSSSELGVLQAGDTISVLSGPLGTPIDLDKFESSSTALLAGGCYGIGAIYPIARALKEKGVKVTCVIEASSSYMLYYDKKLATVCDELIIKTRDGTRGTKGGCSDVIKEIGDNFDSIVTIGCVFMMKQCSKSAPKDTSKNQQCALNPIMVDGTGMCGACRVTVEGDTKFACVDGPFFPLLKVDFNELSKRRTAYKLLEVDAMPRHLGGKCHS